MLPLLKLSRYTILALVLIIVCVIIDLKQTLSLETRERTNETDNSTIQKSGELSYTSDNRFYINESTKIIYVDESNESGFLIGEVGTLGNSEDAATNYSVYLVSRHKEHIAILIDVEEINFESIINCEYQELRLSIVGEIKNGLLDRMEASLNESTQDELSAAGDTAPSATSTSIRKNQLKLSEESLIVNINNVTTSKAATTEAPPSREISIVEDYEPIIPVTEAMALLLNTFVNKTILEEPEELNSFKTIDFCIDYIRDETCREFHNDRQSQLSLISNSSLKPTNASLSENRTKASNRKQGRRRRVNKSRRKGKAMKVESKCSLANSQFRETMAQKLNQDFEWDEFRILCGRTRQLLIPMRSLKLSVYSDEFAPNSRFILSYKFISDPRQLHSKDNHKFYCRNRNVIDLDLKCDGFDDCGDASDESIKICGYPASRLIRPIVPSVPANHEHSYSSASNLNNNEARKIVHYSEELLKCCQASDWMSLTNKYQQQKLQAQDGDSINLFSSLLMVPTASKSAGKEHLRTKRIVGGGVARQGAWPSQVSLQYEILEPLSHFCAGTLIHPLYVITAGHCITRDSMSRGIKVVLGAHDLRQLSGENVQVRYVDEAQIYPGVDVKHLSHDWDNDMNNDIALIRLNAPIIINQNVAPACLPPFNTPLTINNTCRSIGWGQTHGSGNSNILKDISLRVVNSSICSKELLDEDDEEEEENITSVDNGKELTNRPKRVNLTDSDRRNRMKRENSKGSKVVKFETSGVDKYSDLTMLCVNNDHGHGICQGDSGGPLYCDRIAPNGDKCTEIYGVASFIIQYSTLGAMCAVENLPGVFGEVSSKTEWIASTIKMFEQSYRLKYS